MKAKRSGEWGLVPNRRPRYFTEGTKWYYDTREDIRRGPFNFLQEAEIDASEYIEELKSFSRVQYRA